MQSTERFADRDEKVRCELKKSIGSVSQKGEYSLMKLGWSLQPILDAMKDWGEDYKSSLEKKYENHKKI